MTRQQCAAYKAESMTPHAPQMWYTRDAHSNNYCLRIADGYGDMVLELRAADSVFTEDRMVWLREMCERAFGIELVAPGRPGE